MTSFSRFWAQKNRLISGFSVIKIEKREIAKSYERDSLNQLYI